MSTAIRLADIRWDADCQTRALVESETVLEYAEAMKDGATFPPVIVFHDSTTYWLADGYHRFLATKTLARGRGDEETATISADIRHGSKLDAVRFALSANARHGKRREPGDYAKAYEIAVRLGLCEAHDAKAVAELLACTLRWAQRLTQEARKKHDAEREARIQEARERGEPVRKIAVREGISPSSVVYVRKTKPSHFERAPSAPAAERDAKLRAIAARLDRPALVTWSAAHDAIAAATEAIQMARPHACPAAMFDALQAALAALRMELATLNVRIEDEAELRRARS